MVSSLLNLPCVQKAVSGVREVDDRLLEQKRKLSIYQKEYRAKNKEAINLKRKARQAAISTQKASYYESHKDEISRQHKEYYYKNREKTLEKMRRKTKEKAAVRAAEIKAGTRQLTGREKAVEERRRRRRNENVIL